MIAGVVTTAAPAPTWRPGHDPVGEHVLVLGARRPGDQIVRAGRALGHPRPLPRHASPLAVRPRVYRPVEVEPAARALHHPRSPRRGHPDGVGRVLDRREWVTPAIAFRNAVRLGADRVLGRLHG